MIAQIFLIFIFCLTLACAAVPARAETGLYSFPKIEEQKISVSTEKRKLDPFMVLVSKKTGIDEQTLAEEFKRGAGRSEMIRIILIAKKSGQPIGTILREREKGIWFSKITEKYQLDNKSLRKDAQSLLKEIEKELKAEEAKAKAEAGIKPNATTAGVGEKAAP